MKLFLFLIKVAMMLIDLMQLSTQQPLSSNKECSSSAVSACFSPAACLFIVVIEDRTEEILVQIMIIQSVTCPGRVKFYYWQIYLCKNFQQGGSEVTSNPLMTHVICVKICNSFNEFNEKNLPSSTMAIFLLVMKQSSQMYVVYLKSRIVQSHSRCIATVVNQHLPVQTEMWFLYNINC